MNRFFNMDSGLFRFLTRLADLMILNFIFLLTCIPIVTIGAAWTALYYVALKMVRDEESYIVRGYFKSFKENFKQATAMWLIVLVFLILLFIDFRILGVSSGTGYTIIQVGLYVVSMVGAMVLVYLFPLLAKFYNTVKRTFLNAFLMSVRHLPQTLLMLAISAGAVILTFINNWIFAYGVLAWLLIGFALIALANSWFLVRIFDHYIPKEDEDAAQPEEQS